MNIYITPYNLLNYAGIHDEEIKYGEDDADVCRHRCGDVGSDEPLHSMKLGKKMHDIAMEFTWATANCTRKKNGQVIDEE